MEQHDISRGVMLMFKDDIKNQERPIVIIQTLNSVELTWDELKEIAYECGYKFNEPIKGFQF